MHRPHALLELHIVNDGESARYLNGSMVDYREMIAGSGSFRQVRPESKTRFSRP
jgi:Fe-S cluster assembly iron-binding protein IscA